MNINLPNPYEIQEIQELVLEKDNEYNLILAEVKSFLEKKQFIEKNIGIPENRLKYIPFLQEDLSESLWVSKVENYYSWSQYRKVIRVKPRRPTALGRAWDSLWGWK